MAHSHNELAFVLVKWLSDEQTSIVLSAWVTKPTPIQDALPVDGECYWKKKVVAGKQVSWPFLVSFNS